MERKEFLKSLLGLIVAPAIIKDIDWAVPKVQTTGITASLFTELNLLTPTYYSHFTEKYGNKNYSEAWEILGKVNDSEMVVNENIFHFTKD